MVVIKDLSADAEKNVSERPTLERIAYEGAIGRARTTELYNMFYKNGPGNGTMLSLPFDQLIEHGVGHALKWEESANSKVVIELANRGDFSLLVLSIGQAEKYQNLIRADLPLLVKVDGHFLIGNEVNYPRHSNISSVERAVRAGANAIGCTFYLGGEETEQDVERVAEIIEDAHRFEKPVFVWAYARGPFVDKMGADSLYWCAQGISAAESLGADVVKQKFPVPVKGEKGEAYKMNLSKGGYLHSKMPEIDQLLELEPENPDDVSSELHVKRLSFMSQVAPNILKIISGGPKGSEGGLLKTLKCVMDSGIEGQIIGRNLWGRPIEEALNLNSRMVNIMREEHYHRKLTEPRFTGRYE